MAGRWGVGGWAAVFTVVRTNSLGASPELLSPFVFAGAGLSRWIRGWMILHGLLLPPTLILPALSGLFAPSGGEANQIGAPVHMAWCLIFLPHSVMVAIHFRWMLNMAG